jgi:Asp-tRNA(Asn)/Glu-tRNA(Gln) amidotransferase A subunit family amidase
VYISCRQGGERAGELMASAKPLHQLGVREARAALAAREFSPLEYVDALLAWQSRWTVLNAYAQQDVAALREAADRADVAKSPIAGLPVSVKDNIDVVGYATTAGTPGLRDNRPGANAPIIQQLLDLGVVVAGKVGMHEMAAGGTCANIAFGQVRNPYNTTMVPGGSSGGSGAAVAAGLTPASLGTDTAGSVRAPAAHCGCVGFRPTTGRYDRRGLVPGAVRRDTAGWLARSTADIELLDGFSGAPAAPAAPVILKGLRLGVPRGFFYEAMDPTLAPVIEAALTRLRAAGAELIETDIPDMHQLMGQVFRHMRRDPAGDLAVYIAESGATVTPADIIHAIADPQLRPGFEASLAAPAADPAAREAEDAALAALARAYADYFAENRLAALVMPTAPEPAYPAPDDIAAGGTGPVSMIRNTHPVALAGIPGLSVPAGLTAAGLPVGLEIDGPAGSDLTVLKIGQAFEAITPPLPPPAVPA